MDACLGFVERVQQQGVKSACGPEMRCQLGEDDPCCEKLSVVALSLRQVSSEVASREVFVSLLAFKADSLFSRPYCLPSRSQTYMTG